MDEDKCKAIALSLTLALSMSVRRCHLCSRKENGNRVPSVYSFTALSTYNKARRDINLPGRLDWVKFVSSSRPIPVGPVVSK